MNKAWVYVSQDSVEPPFAAVADVNPFSSKASDLHLLPVCQLNTPGLNEFQAFAKPKEVIESGVLEQRNK